MTKRLFFNRFRIFLGSESGNSSLLGILLATALGTILIANTVPFWLETQHHALMDQTTAQQIRQVSDGLAGYTKAYAGAIEGVATATKPAVIPLYALIATGFLPSGTNSLDPYGQTVVGEILQPSPGILVGAVVTQGGTPPAGSHLNQLATLIGAQGGFVPTSDILSLPGICGTNCYQGSGGTWQATFSQYPFTGVGPGSLIALQSYNANNMPQDFLYRSNVPGFPQANQMQTNINMNGNNLNNANQVQTYNLTSPNGTVSTQNLSTGQINTNGQAIYSGSLYTSNNQVSYYSPCGMQPDNTTHLNSCTGTWGIGVHIFCSLVGIYGGPDGPVLVYPNFSGNALPNWTIYSWNQGGFQSSPMVGCFG